MYALRTVEVRDAHVDRVAKDIQYGARVPQRAERRRRLRDEHERHLALLALLGDQCEVHRRATEPVGCVAKDRGVCARLDASTELVEQRACQLSPGKVFFEDLGDREALTRGKAPASDLL